MSYVDPIQQRNLIKKAIEDALAPLVEQVARLEKKIDDLKSAKKDK